MTALNHLYASATPVLADAGVEAALLVERLSHSYGKRKALGDVSVRVDPGAFTVLLGLNGAGKSTLFALVTRLFNARAGRIRIFGHDLRREPGEALRLLGVVFQARTLDLDLTVMQNLTYHAALHGIAEPQARQRAGEVLTQIGLLTRAHDKARNLSGGQMRRVEIARALLHRPRLLLLDEPTAGLGCSGARGHRAACANAHRIGGGWCPLGHAFDR